MNVFFRIALSAWLIFILVLFTGMTVKTPSWLQRVHDIVFIGSLIVTILALIAGVWSLP